MEEHEVKQEAQQVVESLQPKPSYAQVASDGRQEQQAEAPAQQNWRLMRERAEAAERKAQEYERLLQAQQQPQEREDDDLDIADDALTEGKHLKRAYKALRNDYKQTKAQLEAFNAMSAEMRLRSKFSDFDSIVTTENMEKLARQKGSLARSIAANPDLYDKGETAYDAIKAWVATEKYEEQEKKLEENRNKPKAAASAAPQAADTPLTRIADYDRRILTEERKDQLRRQVEEAKRYR